MNITKKLFGKTNGEDVYAYTVGDSDLEAVFLTFGATVQSLKYKGVDVALGYDDLSGYLENDGYLGAVVGRCGNRIAKGVFSLNGKKYHLFVNNGPNHLHGGKIGFSHKIWTAEELSDGVRFSLVSPDGDENYPGTVKVSVCYRLKNGGVDVEYTAVSDADTVCNLTNHTYFNLNGQGSGDVLSHELYLNASAITPVDETLIPDGTVMDVSGTPFDFRTSKPIGKDINAKNLQLSYGPGYDHNFVLDKPLFSYGLAAEAKGDETSITLKVFTDRPGVQFYSGNFLTKRRGKGGSTYDLRNGFCLETQCYPDSVNHPNFPSVILKKGEVYKARTRWEFSK